MNLKLDTDTHDLDISSNGLETIIGIDEIAQKLSVRLQFFLGEWFLDTRLGIPYYEEILIKNPDLVAIQSVFREAILETPGVDVMENFDMNFISAERKLQVNFTVKTITGEVLDFDQEFLIG